MIESAPGELQNALDSWLKLSVKKNRIHFRQKDLEAESEKISKALAQLTPIIELFVVTGRKKFVLIHSTLFEIDRPNAKEITIKTHEVVGHV